MTGEYQSNLNNVVTSGRVKPQKFVRVDIEDIEYVSEVRSLMESVLPELRTLAEDPIALATANKIIQVGLSSSLYLQIQISISSEGLCEAMNYQKLFS